MDDIPGHIKYKDYWARIEQKKQQEQQEKIEREKQIGIKPEEPPKRKSPFRKKKMSR